MATFGICQNHPKSHKIAAKIAQKNGPGFELRAAADALSLTLFAALLNCRLFAFWCLFQVYVALPQCEKCRRGREKPLGGWG